MIALMPVNWPRKIMILAYMIDRLALGTVKKSSQAKEPEREFLF